MKSFAVVSLLLIIANVLAWPGGHSFNGGPMGGPHHIPPFAKNASQDQLNTLKQIMHDANLTRGQLDQKVKDWASAQGGDFLEAYNDFKKNMSAMATKILQKINASTLSNNLKNIAKSLQEIHSNESLTMQAAHERAKALISSISESERRQVHDLLRPEKPRKKRQATAPGPIDQIRHPSFLKQISPAALASFKAIFDNKNLTKKQLVDQISGWASQQSSEIKELYSEVSKKLEKFKEQYNLAITNSTLSTEAKAAVEELMTVYENQDITIEEEIAKRREIIGKQSKSVRKEILKFMREKLRA
ncbi:unnamed protein product [Enterobius vermicularis]|uniref:DUF148 domain-containing protein n=1 Tax=Enterobius vermicularis TaxID=51028 RepID=A0A0N4UV37_ENTVE|nr:unnamed protein product [Enterobius vermicularis]